MGLRLPPTDGMPHATALCSSYDKMRDAAVIQGLFARWFRRVPGGPLSLLASSCCTAAGKSGWKLGFNFTLSGQLPDTDMRGLSRVNQLFS